MSNPIAWNELVDLAAAKFGGVAVLANDEFFAEKDNLLRAHEAEWREHEYTDRGKWMDGWETRRRREPGFDWCIIRLGMPGVIRGVVVDTAFFRGNYPPECSLEGTNLSCNDDLNRLQDSKTQWTEILGRSGLVGDHKNQFAISSEQTFSHVRLNIFPDGGVARLRVHGEVRPDWLNVASYGGLVDLAALENGGFSEACSDMFFGARQNLLAPGRPFNMSDGWETRRRRDGGHDWNLIRLGAAGTVRRLEIDTTHFRGNAPGRVMVEAKMGEGEWRVLLPELRVQAHTRHSFAENLRVLGPVSHVRLNVYPCGGIARFRVWGELANEGIPALASSNEGVMKTNLMAPEIAQAAFLACCGSKRWAAAMTKLLPFEDLAAVLRRGDACWWALNESDWLEAFAAHPQIGGTSHEKSAPAKAAAWSAQEQSLVQDVSESVRQRLAQVNREYAQKHGFTYIVCATGKSAEEMLATGEKRLANSRAQEIRFAAEEQAMITRLRLTKMLEGK